MTAQSILRSQCNCLFHSCIAESKDFHSKAVDGDNPFLYCLLSVPADKVGNILRRKMNYINYCSNINLSEKKN